MATATFVIKRQGKRATEAFNPKKLHASITATCLSIRTPEGQAEVTAQKVCDDVTIWLKDKPEVTSEDIRRRAAMVLEKYHSEAAHLYKYHHLVI